MRNGEPSGERDQLQLPPDGARRHLWAIPPSPRPSERPAPATWPVAGEFVYRVRVRRPRSHLGWHDLGTFRDPRLARRVVERWSSSGNGTVAAEPRGLDT